MAARSYQVTQKYTFDSVNACMGQITTANDFSDKEEKKGNITNHVEWRDVTLFWSKFFVVRLIATQQKKV